MQQGKARHGKARKGKTLPRVGWRNDGGWMGDGIHVERWLWCFGDLFVGVVDRWVGLCTKRVYLLVFRIGRDDLI